MYFEEVKMIHEHSPSECDSVDFDSVDFDLDLLDTSLLDEIIGRVVQPH